MVERMPWYALKNDALKQYTWLWYNNIISITSNYTNIICILVTLVISAGAFVIDQILKPHSYYPINWNIAYVPTSPMDTTLAFLFFMITVECSELYVLSYIGFSGPSVRSYPCVQLQVE